METNHVDVYMIGFHGPLPATLDTDHHKIREEILTQPPTFPNTENSELHYLFPSQLLSPEMNMNRTQEHEK